MRPFPWALTVTLSQIPSWFIKRRLETLCFRTRKRIAWLSVRGRLAAQVTAPHGGAPGTTLHPGYLPLPKIGITNANSGKLGGGNKLNTNGGYHA